jgi:beta-lactamase regulating signal transducer with metallopeptidase domain
MSEFVPGLNSAGSAYIVFAIRMLIQSSVLILVLWLLDLVLRHRVRAVARYWIWLLVPGQARLAAVAVVPDRSDLLARRPTARGDHRYVRA